MESFVDFDVQYSLDDQQFYQLPNRVPCDFLGRRLLGNSVSSFKQTLDNLPPNQRELGLQLVNFYADRLTVWDVNRQNENCQYKFHLPPSMFKKQLQLKLDFHAYENILNYDGNQDRGLTNDQIWEIFRTGSFRHFLPNCQVPYVWQISSWIIKGRSAINRDFNGCMLMAYKAWRFIYQRFCDAEKISNDFLNQFNFTLLSGLAHLLIKPFLFLSLFFGFRETLSWQDKGRVYYEEEVQRQRQIRQLFTEKQLALYRFLSFNDDPMSKQVAEAKKNMLLKFAKDLCDEIEIAQQQIRIIWNALRFEVLKKPHISDQEYCEYQSNVQFQMSKYPTNYIQKYNLNVVYDKDSEQQCDEAATLIQSSMWDQWRDVDEDIKQGVARIARAVQSYQYHTNELINEAYCQQQQYILALKKSSPIRSMCQEFVNEEASAFRNRLIQAQQPKTNQLILQEVQHLPEGLLFQEFNKTYNNRLSRVKRLIRRRVYSESKVIIKVKSTRQCFPPYKVLRRDNGTYYLERQKTYSITSSYPFWKLSLGCLRWFTWTCNSIYWLFANAIYGHLGLKALFAIDEFYPDVSIDSNTGQIFPSGRKTSTVISNLRSVYQGMERSRYHFEHSPDNGFFGKSCSRIFNLIQVYLFRFFFVGVICVLTLKPVFIIINFTLSFALLITAFAWNPIALVLYQLIAVFFYDFDCSGRNPKYLHQTPNCCPIFVLIYQIVVNGILQLIICILDIFVIQPLVAMFFILYGMISYVLRSISDCIMILLVKCLARRPLQDSSLAWQISGPGMAAQYFTYIGLPEILALVAAQLEKCILKEYKTKMQQLIQKPTKQVMATLEPIYRFMGVRCPYDDPGENILMSGLNNSVNVREDLLSVRANRKKVVIIESIRFTEEEIQHIRQETSLFIKSQIIEKSMHEYIWEYFHSEKGDYSALTDRILRCAVHDNVLSPIEALDQRYELESRQNQKLLAQIKNALAGKINLQMPERKLVQKRSLLDLEIEMPKTKFRTTYQSYHQIISNLWELQGLRQLWSSLSAQGNMFYLNYCLNL